MKKYSIIIEGKGIEIPLEEADGQLVRGFIVVRIEKAQTQQEAVDKAFARVKMDWAEGALSIHGASPELAIEEIVPLGIWAGFKARDSAYIFHSEA